MSISQVFKNVFWVLILQSLVLLPVYSLDLDSTVTDSDRTNYNKTNTVRQKDVQVEKNSVQSPVKTIEHLKTEETVPAIETKTKLPIVPALPKNANSSTVAPYNGVYSGKVPNSDAITPCSFVVGDLLIDESVIKTKFKQNSVVANNKNQDVSKKQYKTAYKGKYMLPSGTEFRVISKAQITDYMPVGHTVEFVSIRDFSTAYYKIPKNTRFTAKVTDSHKPQMSCNGGLVKLKIVSANINGHNCSLNARITKIKTDNIHFSNLKGSHTYLKTVAKKAKWGQKMFTKWSKTSVKLANNGAGVVLAPFPYLGGCILSVASTVSSPVTAVLGKGGRVVIPVNTVFTIKLCDDARIN